MVQLKPAMIRVKENRIRIAILSQICLTKEIPPFAQIDWSELSCVGRKTRI